jgi:sugar lactone lactonase YvrE
LSRIGRAALRVARAAALALLGAASATADVEPIAANVVYPEGPLWDGAALLFVEYSGNDVKRWDGTAATVLWHKAPCGPSGLARFGRGHLLVACYDTNLLVELDAAGREVRSFSRDASGRPFIGPNDFAADGKGGVYFTASGVYDLAAPITGAVLHVSADGRRIREVANTIDYSNGLVVSRDGRDLLVAESFAQRILAFPIAPNGELGLRRVWARLADLAPPTPGADAYNGPDGIKLGPDGNYYVAQNGSGRVLVVSEARKLVHTIPVPTPFVTNIAFGPPAPGTPKGSGTLYITGSFDQFKAPYPGAVYRWSIDESP